MAAELFKHLVRELASGQLTETNAADTAYREVASPAELGPGAHDALGELAFLAVGADGDITPEEETLLRQWFELLDGNANAYGRRFDTYSERRRADGRTARLNAVAAGLTTPAARRLGYAIVFALTNSDLARSPREERFEGDVAIALGLDSAQTSELELLVMGKLTVR